eukprot:1859185-Prymnesium_polylepis.1
MAATGTAPRDAAARDAPWGKRRAGFSVAPAPWAWAAARCACRTRGTSTRWRSRSRRRAIGPSAGRTGRRT